MLELSTIGSTPDEIELTPLNPRHARLTILMERQRVFRFGRNLECDQCFHADFRISGTHATLSINDSGTADIVDHSVNGTFVNGERLPKHVAHTLHDGDALYLVVPDRSFLEGGGSLSTNFVGYTVQYRRRQAARTDSTTTTGGANPKGQVSSLGDAAVQAEAGARDDGTSQPQQASHCSSSMMQGTGDNPHAFSVPSNDHVSFASWWLLTGPKL
jgi:predicted component of type VI protein secretion system